MNGRERADLTRPRRGQVDSSHLVPVHYYSTVSAPELSLQFPVRLEYLPASWTRHTGRSGSQHNKRQEHYPSHNSERHPTIS
jgi:hypothetical protein